MTDLERESREVDRSEYTCGDNSCVFGSPGGMATNGGCRCFDDLPRTPDGRVTRRRLTRGILTLRQRATLREKEIEELRALRDNLLTERANYEVCIEERDAEIASLRARVAELEGMVSEATLYLDGTFPAEAALELRIAQALKPIPLPETEG